jgi:hypothetical protein
MNASAKGFSYQWAEGIRKTLFEPVLETVKAFFRQSGYQIRGHGGFSGIDGKGEILNHPEA